MSWLGNLLGEDSGPTQPQTDLLSALWRIPFGGNNSDHKSYQTIRKWQDAESSFEKKEYDRALELSFDFLRDDQAENVNLRVEGKGFVFELIQGSSIIRGVCDQNEIIARATMATMPSPSIAGMNRILVQSFQLRYSRFALDDDNGVCLLFDLPVELASPNRLYNGLREIALNADRFREEQISEFALLPVVQHTQTEQPTGIVINTKYKYFRIWISDTLEQISGLQPDSFSGAVAYILLTTLYRIKFLVAPLRPLRKRLDELEVLYLNRKPDIPIVVRNAQVAEGLKKLLDISPEEFSRSILYDNKIFSELELIPPGRISEQIRNANRDAEWYIANRHPEIALAIVEYGLVNSLCNYSVPAVISQLSTLLLAILHQGFFEEIGVNVSAVKDPVTNLPLPGLIIPSIDAVLNRWVERYPYILWDHRRINYESIWGFTRTFTEQIANLNLDTRK